MARWKYHPNIPATIDIPDVSMGDIFFNAVEKAGSKPFIYFEGKMKTYAEAAREVRKMANALQNIGVKKGDRIAILSPNTPQFVITYLSTIYLGAVIVAISPVCSAKEVKFQLHDSGAKVIVTLDMYLDLIREIRNETELEHVIASSVGDELNAIKGFLYKKVIARKNPKISENEINYKDFLNAGEDMVIKVDIDPKDDIMALQYTGGTTGVPKAAMLTHKNLVSQAYTLDYWMEWIGGKIPLQETNLGALPFSHIFGLTTSFLWPMSIGGMIVLIPDPRKLEGVMKSVQKYKIQFFMGVPTLFQKLAEHPNISKYDWTSLRMCISGGSALHPEVMKNFENKTGTVLVEGYGLSEASPVTHINPADAGIRQEGIGMPIPNTEVKIIDINSGEDIPDEFDEDGLTAEGELCIKGPQVMKGYWNKPEESKKVLLKGGWLRTGDVVKMNEDGFFRIVDRLKDCIFTSGYQVWPLEVETVLQNHPEISLAAVISIEEPNTHNEVIKAVLVKTQDGRQHSKEELKVFCKKHLAPYKVPKFFEYREELPLSSVGKVLRRPLREEAAAELVKSVTTDS